MPRPTSVTLTATGVSSWIPINWRQTPLGVSLSVILGGHATPNVTYTVQHTTSDLGKETKVSISRSNTTATVTWAGHGAATGDSVVMKQAGSPFDTTGSAITVVDANSFSYTVANTGPTTAKGIATMLNVLNHDVLASKTVSDDGNYAYPPTAIRLNATITAGTATMNVVQSAT
jgi:hypothetical protein